MFQVFYSKNQDDQKIFQALKENPELRAFFLEMIDIPKDTLIQLNRGDDAEEAIIQAIREENYQHRIGLFHMCEYFSEAVSAWQTNTKAEVTRRKELEEEITKIVEKLRDRQKSFLTARKYKVA
jgi:L-lactate utilization protein LutC